MVRVAMNKPPRKGWGNANNGAPLFRIHRRRKKGRRRRYGKRGGGFTEKRTEGQD